MAITSINSGKITLAAKGHLAVFDKLMQFPRLPSERKLILIPSFRFRWHSAPPAAEPSRLVRLSVVFRAFVLCLPSPLVISAVASDASERVSEHGGVASSASPLDALPPAPRLPLLAIQLPRIAVAAGWRAMMAERETERRVSKGNQLCFASRLNLLRDD